MAAARASTPHAYNPRHLCFPERAVEQGFLKLRHAKLANKVFQGLALLLGFILLHLVQLALASKVFQESPEALRVARVRYVYIAFVASLAIVGMAVAKSSRLRAKLGPTGFELFTCLLACIVAAATPWANLWFLSRASGVANAHSIMEIKLCVDDNVLLMLDVWLTGCHLLLPMRWTMLWPVEVVVILAYIVPALWLSPLTLGIIIQNIALLTILVVAAALGKRALEVHERTAFKLLAAERTLRCEAEHRLSEMVGARSSDVVGRRDVDTASSPTNRTGEIFDVRSGGPSMEERLKRILHLGFSEHWLIGPELLQPCDSPPLGSGGFGTVMLALYHGAEVVLKAPRRSCDAAKATTLLSVAEELRIFRRLRHPNIVVFYGSCIDPRSSEVLLVLEFVRGKELSSSVHGVVSTPAGIVDRCHLADDICCALRYLHAQQPAIIHGDIKGSNVLVEMQATRRTAKLLDFGLSRLLTRNLRDLGGTVTWMAPEVITRDKSAFGTSADVFSFGRLLYMIMTGRYPVTSVRKDELIEAARRGEIPALDWPEKTPWLRLARTLCDACLQLNPGSRVSISAAQADLHKWGTCPNLPEDVAHALRAAFPRQPIFGGDLQESVERARGGPLLLSQAPAEQRPHRPGERPVQRLAKPRFEETPDSTKMMCIGAAMCFWNVPMAAGSCCEKHALQNETQRVLDLLHAQPCRRADTDDRWQCPSCKALVPAPSSIGIGAGSAGSASECDVCGYEGGLTLPGSQPAGRGSSEQQDEEAGNGSDSVAAAVALAQADLVPCKCRVTL